MANQPLKRFLVRFAPFEGIEGPSRPDGEEFCAIDESDALAQCVRKYCLEEIWIDYDRAVEAIADKADAQFSRGDKPVAEWRTAAEWETGERALLAQRINDEYNQWAGIVSNNWRMAVKPDVSCRMETDP